MSWGGWSIQPPLAYVAVAAMLYWVGGRGFRRGGQSWLHSASFFAGLATIVVALESPLDGYADTLFWAHMFQHVLLLTVAPPLILLGRPWPRMWRAIPRDTRARLGRSLARARWTAPLRMLARPLPAWILFNATIIGWHIPAAYNATLTSSTIHDLEHAMFFFSGLLFWARVIDPGPLRPRLPWPARIAYVLGAMIVGWVIAITLVIVPEPIYSHYAQLASRPGGITALTDQQIAAGVMWVPGSLAFGIAMIFGFYRWLEPDSSAPARHPALTT
ncbi:MAG TPA: cytochrome c oxidase assembly protein [Solirubrobacteraceae bacterium]|jgi:cytochrome c oxidase assembly factor CtaG